MTRVVFAPSIQRLASFSFGTELVQNDRRVTEIVRYEVRDRDDLHACRVPLCLFPGLQGYLALEFLE